MNFGEAADTNNMQIIWPTSKRRWTDQEQGNLHRHIATFAIFSPLEGIKSPCTVYI